MTFSEGLVSLNQIRVFARHGALDQERLTGGEFVVSVVVKTDFSKALLTDAVDDTVNYAALLDIVRAEMAIPSRLLEQWQAASPRRCASRSPQSANSGWK